jgi:hypothetical protein
MLPSVSSMWFRGRGWAEAASATRVRTTVQRHIANMNQPDPAWARGAAVARRLPEMGRLPKAIRSNRVGLIVFASVGECGSDFFFALRISCPMLSGKFV